MSGMKEKTESCPKCKNQKPIWEQLQVCRAEIKNLRNEIRNLKLSTNKKITELWKNVQDDKLLEYNCRNSKSCLELIKGKGIKCSISNVISVFKEDRTSFEPIGYLWSQYKTKNATPRQGTINPNSKARINILKDVFTNPSHSLENLSSFSHLWILFVFHKNDSENGVSKVKAKVKPPRLNGEKVGVFSTRSPHRPNPIGLTLAKIDDVTGDNIYLSGVDILDGTPILDIKPYIPDYDNPVSEIEENTDHGTAHAKLTNRDVILVPEWVSCKNSLSIRFHERVLKRLNEYFENEESGKNKLMSEMVRILSADPRSVYRKATCQDRMYYCTIDNFHLTCWFDDDERFCEVLKVKNVHPEAS